MPTSGMSTRWLNVEDPGSLSEFREWLRAVDGFHGTDPWNIRDLYELILDGENLGDTDRYEICVLRLQALGRKAIVTWETTPAWTENFFEIGTNTTFYDEIEVQIFCSGRYVCDYFWIGTMVPTSEQIERVQQRYRPQS